MKIFNLHNNSSDKQLLIKHETAVDPDDGITHDNLLFKEYEAEKKELELSPNDIKKINHLKEMIDFHYYFKSLLHDNKIGVQVFEFVKASVQLSDYSHPRVEWEDSKGVELWRNNFKTKHQLYLYFYNPKKRMQAVHSGYIDSASTLYFSDENLSEEYFEIKDYLAYEFPASGTFQVEISAPQIYKCLASSSIPQCKKFFSEFQSIQLNKKLEKELSEKSMHMARKI